MRLSRLHESLEDDIYHRYPDRPKKTDETLPGDFLAHLERTRARFYGGPLFCESRKIVFPRQRSTKLTRWPNLEAGIYVHSNGGGIDDRFWCYSPVDRMLYILDANGIIRGSDGWNHRELVISVCYMPEDITPEERTHKNEIFPINYDARPRYKIKVDKRSAAQSHYWDILNRFKHITNDEKFEYHPPTKDEQAKEVIDDVSRRSKLLDIDSSEE